MNPFGDGIFTKPLTYLQSASKLAAPFFMDQNGKSSKLQGLQALGLVWDIILAIALPTTLLALVGRWLDGKLQTSPLFTLLGLALALVIVYLMVSRKAKEIAERLKTQK